MSPWISPGITENRNRTRNMVKYVPKMQNKVWISMIDVIRIVSPTEKSEKKEHSKLGIIKLFRCLPRTIRWFLTLIGVFCAAIHIRFVILVFTSDQRISIPCSLVAHDLKFRLLCRYVCINHYKISCRCSCYRYFLSFQWCFQHPIDSQRRTCEPRESDFFR